jgi:hypothetical protein
VVLLRADGSELYRDGTPSFDIHSDRVLTDRFEIETPANVAGGRIRGTMVLNCGEDRRMLAGIALALLATALAGGLGVGLLVFRTVKRGLAPMMETDAQMNLFMFAMMNKEVKGTVFGSTNPRAQIPNLLSMYREGELKLDELITRRYSLDDVNQGYVDMREGKNLRGVIEFG